MQNLKLHRQLANQKQCNKGSKTLKIPVYILNFLAPRPSIAKTSTAHKTVAKDLLILTEKKGIFDF